MTRVIRHSFVWRTTPSFFYPALSRSRRARRSTRSKDIPRNESVTTISYENFTYYEYIYIYQPNLSFLKYSCLRIFSRSGESCCSYFCAAACQWDALPSFRVPVHVTHTPKLHQQSRACS